MCTGLLTALLLCSICLACLIEWLYGMYVCNFILFARSRVRYSGHPSQEALCGPEQFGQEREALHPSLQ